MKLHNAELLGLCPSPNIIRVIKSKRVILARHMACVGKRRNTRRVLVGTPEGKNYL
jgi:hypothetical protein